MWNLTGKTATWQSDQLHTAIDLRHPELGLHRVVILDHLLHHVSLMRISLPPSATPATLQLENAYTRGSDLVVSYENAARGVHPEFRWRIEPVRRGAQPEGAMIEMLISTRSDWLESDPTVNIGCQLPATTCDVLRDPGAPARIVFPHTAPDHAIDIDCSCSSCALAFHLAEMPLVFGELFDTADVARAGLAADQTHDTIASTITFFPGQLERGVIRRTQLRAVLVPEECAERVLAQQWADMIASPPPLTT